MQKPKKILNNPKEVVPELIDGLVNAYHGKIKKLESVGALVLNNYMKFCFRKDAETESGTIDSLARAISVWGRVRVGD